MRCSRRSPVSSGWNADTRHVALAAQHRPAVDRWPAPRRPAPTRSTTGARMNTAWNGPPLERRRTARSASNESTWRPNALRRTAMSMRAERPLVGPAVEHVGRQQDHAGAGAEHRQAVGEPLGERLEKARRLEQHRHRRRLAAGHAPARRRRRARRACGPRTGAAPSAVERVSVQRRRRPAARARRPCIEATSGGLRLGRPDAVGIGSTSPGRRASVSSSSISMPGIGLAEAAAHLGQDVRRRGSGWSPRRWPWPGPRGCRS